MLRGLEGVDPTIKKSEAGQTWEAVAVGVVEKKLPRRARGFFLNKRHVGWKQAMEAFARAGSAGSGEEERHRENACGIQSCAGDRRHVVGCWRKHTVY